jgi:cyclic-di-GMP-binding protein
MLGQDIELNLSIPDQTLISLSFADHTPAAIKAWVKDLPMANVGELSRQLYQAIIEVNKLALAPMVRTQILELLRPPIDYVCKELSKHFLNQSVVLSEKQQKIANLAQAIQIHLASAYKIVLLETVPQMHNEKARKNFTCAAHRLMSEYGQVLLRASQLYIHTPKNIWFEMHSIYKFAEHHELLKYTVADEQRKDGRETRLDQIYKQNLLLSSCRANQLRQNEIQTAYNAFELWSDLVTIGAAQIDESVFVINMEQDFPPRYKSLLKSTSASHYGFNTTELINELNSHLAKTAPKGKSNKLEEVESSLAMPKHISDVVLDHLHHSFGVLTKRSFKRIDDAGSLDLCIGLSASHYFTSGKIEFHTQMLQHATGTASSDDNIFLSAAQKGQDVWGDSYDTGGHSATTPSDSPISFSHVIEDNLESAYPSYTVPLVNTSPGGYCLQWEGEVPSNIQAGEIITLRENRNQEWSIAVIRWIRHIKKQGTQIGIELLAPSARPCGVQLLQKTGDPSEYLRGLLLPELSAIGQPATLVTPRLPFQSGHKVSIRLSGAEGKCQLEKRVSATSSFNQFELSESSQLKNLADEPKAPIDVNTSEDDFDSLWPTL